MRMFACLGLVLVSVLSGCATVVPVVNSTNISEVDFSKAEEFKKGRACGFYILGIVGPFGSNSIHKAALNGQISKVKVAETVIGNYVIFSRSCTYVYGL